MIQGRQSTKEEERKYKKETLEEKQNKMKREMKASKKRKENSAKERAEERYGVECTMNLRRRMNGRKCSKL